MLSSDISRDIAAGTLDITAASNVLAPGTLEVTSVSSDIAAETLEVTAVSSDIATELLNYFKKLSILTAKSWILSSRLCRI